MDDLLKLLKQNGRESIANLAAMLETDESVIEAKIAEYQNKGIIRGFQAVINEDLLDIEYVRAAIEVRITPDRGRGYDNIATRISKFPEVESVALMSGGYDLLVIVKDQHLKAVAGFVNERLATIEGVLSTATHFTLKSYKDQGVLMNEESDHERLQVAP